MQVARQPSSGKTRSSFSSSDMLTDMPPRVMGLATLTPTYVVACCRLNVSNESPPKLQFFRIKFHKRLFFQVGQRKYRCQFRRRMCTRHMQIVQGPAGTPCSRSGTLCGRLSDLPIRPVTRNAVVGSVVAPICPLRLWIRISSHPTRGSCCPRSGSGLGRALSRWY